MGGHSLSQNNDGATRTNESMSQPRNTTGISWLQHLKQVINNINIHDFIISALCKGLTFGEGAKFVEIVSFKKSLYRS